MMVLCIYKGRTEHGFKISYKETVWGEPEPQWVGESRSLFLENIHIPNTLKRDTLEIMK